MASLSIFTNQFFDANGHCLSGGKVWTYIAGTTTLKDSYTTSVGDVPNTNPVILNSRGEADIWLSGAYKIKLTDASDVQIYVKDNISSNVDYASLAATTGSALVGDNTGGALWTTVKGFITYLLSSAGSSLIGNAPSGTVADVIGGGSLNLVAVGQATPPSVAINATAGNLNGLTYYSITFITVDGESEVSTISSGVTPANQQVNLTNIPISVNPIVTGRRIYRTKVGGADTILGHLVTTISDNTTTTYTDNIPDASLGVSSPRIGTAGGIIIKNGLRIAATNGTTTVFGQHAHDANSGYANSAFGANCLTANTTGYRNSAFGIFALYSNTTGSRNSAFGVHALNYLETAVDNTAFGYAAGMWTTGSYNVAIGSNALNSNSTGENNVAIGASALVLNSTGHSNMAIGSSACWNGTTGYQNTAIGQRVLFSNTTGNFNTTLGAYAAESLIGSGNVAIGFQALRLNTAGSNNVCIGTWAGYFETGSNKLFIDNKTHADEATARIDALIYGVFGANAAGQTLAFNAAVNVNGTFGCNGVAAQGKYTVNAACTDLTTAVALVNQLRAALIANGICV